MNSRLRLALSLLLPFIACSVQWLLWDSYIKPYVWFLFFPTAFFSAWLGGVAGGVSSAVIGALLVWFVYIPPQFSLEPKGMAAAASIALFIAMGGLYSWFFQRLGQVQQHTREALKSTEVANAKITQLYKKALELDELKSQFFANVSHELRTPLSLIITPLENRLKLPIGTEFPEKARRETEMMLRNARLLYRHVSDLLDVAKIEGGAMSLYYSPIDLSETVRTLASHFAPLAQEHGIAYHTDVPPNVGIEADGERLQRILLNLLSNAFKFTPDGGAIAVRLRAKNGSALIEVQDNGPGVPEAMREAVFERFRQIEGTTNRRHGGTGLGLAIVREFVMLHGGNAAVTDAPGGGALFTVQLPLKAPAGTILHEQPRELDVLIHGQAVDELRTSVQSSVAPSRPASPQVLVVEDNADMNAFLVSSLQGQYRVASAFDGQAGLDKALEISPDLILADVMMPVMSGDVMAERMRGRPELSDVPIVMLTAKEDDQLRLKLLQIGVQDYLNKPFSVAELLARVDGLIRSRRDANERLRASENRFEATFERAAMGIALVAPDGRWLRVNHKLCAIVGYLPGELQSMTVRDITHPDDRVSDVDFVRRLLAKEIESYSTEKRYIRKDGELTWVSLTVSLARRPDGEPDYLIAVIEDISARKMAAATQKEQDQMLSDMSAMAHIGGWAFDPGSGLGSWTPECARIYDLQDGSSIDVASGLSYYKEGEHRQAIAAAVREAAERGIPYDLTLEIVTAQGRSKWVRTIGHPVLENGRVTRVFGTLQDITASRQTEEELRHRNEELERFNRASEGRELRMIALKREVDTLAGELGRPAPYDLSFAEDPDRESTR